MSAHMHLVGAVAGAVAALSAVSAGAAPAGSTTPQPTLPAVPTTRVIAIGTVTAKWTPEAIRSVMPREVRETLALYLAGKIDSWYMRRDRPGVIFVFNLTDPHEVERLLDALPLGRSGLMEFDVIPVGPLAPLGLLAGPPET